ncbi:MAG: hypothetical protein QG570_752 [Patescibacteria group bacterium]|nr:hypothetical protein [Patescibacteria group bacterium]
MKINKLIFGLIGIFLFLLSSNPINAGDDLLIGGIGYEQDSNGQMKLMLKDITFDPLHFNPIPTDGIGGSGGYLNDYVIVIGDYTVVDGKIVPTAGGDMFSFSLNEFFYSFRFGITSPSQVTPDMANEFKTALDAMFRQDGGMTIPLNALLPRAMIEKLNAGGEYYLSYLKVIRSVDKNGNELEDYGTALGKQLFYFDYTAPLDDDDTPEPILDPTPPPSGGLTGPSFNFDGGLFDGCTPSAGIGACLTALGSNAHILAIGLGVVASLFMLPLIGLNLSSGDPATIQKGKDMFMSWIQGLFLIILSGVIVRIVATDLFGVL